MSESIRICCHGICTHYLQENGHRLTILANVSDQARINSVPELRSYGVHAHIAALTIRTDDIIGEAPSPWWFEKKSHPLLGVTEWRLHGVHIELAEHDPKHDQKGDFMTSECIPHLREVVEVPPPPELLEGKEAMDPVNTACHLELPPSNLIGKNNIGGAVYTTALIETCQPPVLRVTRFDSNDTVDIHVKSGSEVALSNLTREIGLGMHADFLLHFFATKAVPASSKVGRAERERCSTKEELPRTRPTLMGDTTGPGCSNTNYP